MKVIGRALDKKGYIIEMTKEEWEATKALREMLNAWEEQDSMENVTSDEGEE